MDILLQNELQPELGVDEKLIWTGKPKAGLIFQPYDLFLIPFSLLWCGMISFTLVSALRKSSEPFFLIFITPFLLVGLYLLAGRFYLDARRRANTVYGITDGRIIIRSGAFTRSVKSFNVKALSDLTLRERRDGKGTIFIGPTDPRYAMFSGIGNWPGVPRVPSLESIDDVRRVYNIILEIQRKQP